MSGRTGGLAEERARPWALPQSPGASGWRRLHLPLIDKIWRVRGELLMEEAIAADAVFARLDPLFQTAGTTHVVDDNTLTYTKRNPAAQDPLATFTRGSLRLEPRGRGSVLRYDLSSTALLLCFLAPLLFLAFAQIAVGMNVWEKANVEASEKAKKEEDKPKAIKTLNPIDEFLGAPAPEDPSKKKDKKKDEGRHSPTPAHVLAGLFFTTYLVGRVLEPWLIRRRLRRALTDA